MANDPGPAIIGEAVFRSETLPSEEEGRRRREIEETADVEIFASSELERLEGVEGVLVYVPLWAQGARHDVGVRGREAVRVVFEGDPLTPRYLIRANEVRANIPATLAEWQEREAARRAGLEEQAAKQAARIEELRRTAEPVTFDDVLRDGVRLTIRQAAQAVEAAGGILRVADGRLVVELPPAKVFASGAPSRALKASSRLYRAETAVVEAAKRGKVSASALPDRFALPSGALAP